MFPYLLNQHSVQQKKPSPFTFLQNDEKNTAWPLQPQRDIIHKCGRDHISYNDNGGGTNPKYMSIDVNGSTAARYATEIEH